MKTKQLNSIRLLSLAGLIVTCIQIVLHLRGTELCFNDTCSLVESYISLNPFVVNMAGAIFFLSIFAMSLLIKKDKSFSLPLELVILCGFISEGILLSIQIFLARSFCSYCLIICCLVFLIGLIYRPRLFVTGIIFAALEISCFAVIKLPYAGNISLNSGTFAVKSCSSPVSVAYLLFSENCPHCRKVLDSLHGCVSCEIHFNPVSKIDGNVLPGLLPLENYKPEINILALKLFDISSVPVMIEQTETGFGIIKGDRAIIRYINEKCFCGRGRDLIPAPSGSRDLLAPQDEGVCSMEQECR